MKPTGTILLILYKTLVIRIGMLVAVFAFVKTPDDIVHYATICECDNHYQLSTSFLWIKRESFPLLRLSSSNFSSHLNHS